MKRLLIMLLAGCTIELKSGSVRTSSDGINQRYDYSSSVEPDYDSDYDWDCWDSQYSWDSFIEVEAFDCDAYAIDVEVEYLDYSIEYSDLDYYGGCDWYTSFQVEDYECSEIYDVTITVYY